MVETPVQAIEIGTIVSLGGWIVKVDNRKAGKLERLGV